ncbi:AraC family transcriptional regulator [Achromobacter denitrificans]|nr:AraC family transcriptional regulator [Achromobacter denitrificans]
MDSLSQLLSAVEPAGTVDLLCRYGGRWRADHPQAPAGHVPYHVILQGEGVARIGRDELALRTGDILLLPHGASHLLRGIDERAPTAAAPPDIRHNGVLTELTQEGAGPGLEMLCGVFTLGRAGSLLLMALPQAMVLRAAPLGDNTALAALLALMRAEAGQPRLGGAAIINQLSTALFTLVLRALVHDGRQTRGLLALMADPRLAPAVQSMLRSPCEPWTLATLAQRCHLSRATFARQFVRASGLTPLRLLTAIRMEHAARQLERLKESVARVAAGIGYQSEAAFARAFKQHFGVGPGTYRRHGAAPAVAPAAIADPPARARA